MHLFHLNSAVPSMDAPELQGRSPGSGLRYRHRGWPVSLESPVALGHLSNLQGLRICSDGYPASDLVQLYINYLNEASPYINVKALYFLHMRMSLSMLHLNLFILQEQSLRRDITRPSRPASKGSKDHLEWPYLLGTTKAGVIKAVPRREDSHPIPLRLPPGISISLFSKASHLWRTTKFKQGY